MAYSIKHVHLLENSPFKKISTHNKTMNDNDGEWIDRMQKRIDTYRIDSVKTRLIENFIYIKLYLNCTHNYRYNDIYVYYTHLDFY